MNSLQLSSIIDANKKDLLGVLAIQDNEEIFAYKSPQSIAENVLVASVTKSILSALVGIAIDKGFIRNTAQRVLDFFPEYVCPPDEQCKRSITIQHLLTMSAPYPYPNWKEPLERFCRQADWTTSTLNMLGNGGTMGSFKYSSFGAHLLSAVLTRGTGMSAREFANEQLFLPLGLEPLPDNSTQKYDFEALFQPMERGWVHDRQGINAGGWGLCITLQDMARIGQLYLNNGLWNGKQLLSSGYIQQSITPVYPRPVYLSFNYGYLWWLREFQGRRAFLAVGDGGNTLCCIPDCKLVVAITAKHLGVGKEIDFPAIIETFLPPEPPRSR